VFALYISGDVTAQVALQPALKFNGGGHINHTIFWTNLSPNGGGEPKGGYMLMQLYLYFVHSKIDCSLSFTFLFFFFLVLGIAPNGLLIFLLS
jgi:hypothetical protein